MEQIKAHFLEARQVLDAFLANVENFEKIEAAGKLMVQAIAGGGKIISCGNGGSLCDAMHFAEELVGRYRGDRPSLPAIAVSDASYISCTANDYGYQAIFSRYVQGIGRSGDVLLAISTSGNSENILAAAEVARTNGLKIVALTGKDGGKLAHNCDVEIRAPYSPYADRAQEIHIKVIHCLIDFIESKLAE